MRFLFLFFSFINCSKIIKNINVKSCKNCIYFKPDENSNDFLSKYSECTKFGEKDIITNKIEYSRTERSRNDEEKCGLEGKYFEQEKNIKLKLLKHYIVNNSGKIIIFILALPIILLYIVSIVNVFVIYSK
jgi:hypothetical protein